MKIGVLGGTFDPVHFGHLAMAHHVLEQMKLDRICFLPNGRPPHKSDSHIADKHHRLEMIKLAISGVDRFYVSDYEIAGNQYKYTIDTIEHFMAESPDDEFFFIIGADSLFNLDRWHEAERLKKICSFIVCDRPGCSDTDSEILRLKNSGCRIEKADMPLSDIQSTAIRELISNNIGIEKLVPATVADYIYKNKLYR